MMELIIDMNDLAQIEMGIDILEEELNVSFNKEYSKWSCMDHNRIAALCELESRKEELSCGIR